MFINNNGTYETEDGYAVDEKSVKMYEFLESLDRTLPIEEQRKLYMDYVFGTDYSYLSDQMSDPDAEERMASFFEALSDAMETDQEDWSDKGDTMVKALCCGNMSYFMTGICGWSFEGLAKIAMLIRDETYDFHPEDMSGKMYVRWSNGKETLSNCLVDVGSLGVYNYCKRILKNCWKDDATIEEILVEVAPIEGGPKHRFQCVSMKEMKASGKKHLYWYTPNPKNSPDAYSA